MDTFQSNQVLGRIVSLQIVRVSRSDRREHYISHCHSYSSSSVHSKLVVQEASAPYPHCLPLPLTTSFHSCLKILFPFKILSVLALSPKNVFSQLQHRIAALFYSTTSSWEKQRLGVEIRKSLLNLQASVEFQ